jgi:glycerophosphoryl diester phosphodiesterase
MNQPPVMRGARGTRDVRFKRHIALLLSLGALVAAALSGCRVAAPVVEVVPLEQAHAHNDYEHDRPLYDALDHGFTSVEADVHLVDGELLVAHDPDDVEEDLTLRSLYLDPLRERVSKNGGRIYAGGPQFTLLIDIKTDAEETYTALRRVLEEYEAMLTVFGPDGQKDGAIIVIISGNRAREAMAGETVRYTGYDGRLDDLESGAPSTFIPLISDKWTAHFMWQGTGPMPESERQKLRDIVETAHAQGQRVRFWATPDDRSQARQAVWRELVAAGVDLINTDDLEGLQQFLLEIEGS